MARKTNTAAVVAENTEATTTETPVEETATKTKAPKKAWDTLTDERIAWVAAHARPAVSQCLCGCEGETKGRFAPGHDATLKAHLSAHAEKGNETAQAALATFGW